MTYSNFIPLTGRAKDLTGNTFGILTAIGPVKKNGYGYIWLCVCDCGNQRLVHIHALHGKDVVSCGCTRIKHGMCGTRIYRIWGNMRGRCNNVNVPEYPLYGGRGIHICDKWNDFSAFYADMGDPPTVKHTLERIDNNDGYSKHNCKWATQKQQMRNTRHNHVITHDGMTMCLVEWAEHLNITTSTLANRFWRKWSTERALTTP